jgi:glycosyltransferase involved in cell wall biosynthesis
MRILHTVLDDGWGGREQRIIETASWQRSRGHEVWLAAPHNNELPRRAAARQLPAFALSRFQSHAAEELRAVQRRHDINVVDCHGHLDAEAAVRARLPITLVYTLHRQLNANDLTNQFRAVWPRIDRTIAVAKAIKKELLDQGLVAPARLHVVGEWAPPTFFEPPKPETIAAARSQLGIIAGRPTVAFVAMMRDAKGLELFLDACQLVSQIIPALQILVVGSADTTSPGTDSPVFRHLRSRAETLGISESLVLTGFREDVQVLIHLADLLIVPSRREAQSKVIPESFACGTPVIATSVGGIPELVEHGVTGWLVDPGNAASLARQVVECLQQPLERVRIAEHAKRFARDNLDLNNRMEETLACYHLASLTYH